MRRIGFIVDHPKRDLPGGELLAHALAQRGIETALIPLYDQAIDVPLLGLDALVVNYARPVNRPLVECYRALGLPIFVLDTEGGILADSGGNSPPAFAAAIKNSGYAPLIDGYFFWGSTLRDAFADGSGLPSDRLHLTGCPRFDYAAPRWRGLLAKPGGYVLANANFPLANPRFSGSTDQELETMVAAGWPRDYAEQLVTDVRLIADLFVETIAEAATRLPDQRFLVRPHPFENDDRYRSAFAALPNVVVDGRGSVLEVIANARCVLHVNCGTAVEALMLERLPVALDFINTPLMERHSSLPNRVSLRVASLDALVETIRDAPAQTATFDFDAIFDRVIAPWFHRNDGDAADRVADILADHVADRPVGIRQIRTALSSSRPRSSAAQRLQALAGVAMGTLFVSRLRGRAQPRRHDKMFARDAVAQALARIAGHAGTIGVRVDHARSPLTAAPLSSVLVMPKASS